MYGSDGICGIFYVGGIVGYLKSSSTMENCTNSGDVSAKGSYNVGGIAGKLSDSAMKNCTNSGDVSSYYSDEFYLDAGGIVGKSDNSTEENCVNNGKVNGK